MAVQSYYCQNGVSRVFVIELSEYQGFKSCNFWVLKKMCQEVAKHDLGPIFICCTQNTATKTPSAAPTVHNLHFRWSQLSPTITTLFYIRSTSFLSYFKIFVPQAQSLAVVCSNSQNLHNVGTLFIHR